MKIDRLDHLVLTVKNIEAIAAFDEQHLGMMMTSWVLNNQFVKQDYRS